MLGIKGCGKDCSKFIKSGKSASNPRDGVVFADDTVGEGGGKSLAERSPMEGVDGEGSGM